MKSEQEIHNEVADLAASVASIAGRARSKLKTVSIALPAGYREVRFSTLLESRLKRLGIEALVVVANQVAPHVQLLAIEFDSHPA